MSEKSKQALKVENNQQFPNNNTGYITPSRLREFNTDMIDSLVDEISYNADSASWNAQILQISASAGGDTSALNAYTASQDQKNLTLASVTSSLEVTDTLFANKFTNIGSQSGSWDNTSLNAYTQSNDTKWSNIASQSGSWITESETGSFTPASTFNAYTQSNDTKWNNIASQSGSWVTESETGSFARTDVTNNFTQTQNFTNVTVSGTASVAFLNVTYESSSVIYSSGSNQFGDAANDVQTLYGSTRIINELTASGLNYPTVDGLEYQTLQTDGLGNLAFDYTKTLYKKIKNGEGTAIVKGTPLYVSGSQGDLSIVYAADAGNPLRMPASLIAFDNSLAGGAEGTAVILGLIDNVNTTGYTPGTEVYVGVGGGWTAVRPTGSTTPIQPLGIVTREGTNGAGIVLTQVPFDLPNIQDGYLWVGNGTNQPIAVATSSIVTNVNTASFATTGSNVFTGDQTLIDAAGNTVTLTDSSGSLILVAKGFTSSSAHITGSGNQTNLIFKPNNNTADTIISGSGNIITNLPAPTAGFKRFFTAGNLAMSNGSLQISASMAFPLTSSGNYYANLNTTVRGPVSSSTWFISNNDMLGAVNFGSSAANNAQRAVSGVTFVQNFQNGTFNFIANRTNLETTTTIRQSSLGGTITLNAASSSVIFDANIAQGTLTITNSSYKAGNPGGNLVQMLGGVYVGISNTISVSGSTTNADPLNDYNKHIIASNILGYQNAFSVDRTDVSSSTALVGTTLVGANLIVTGSNSFTYANTDASTIGTVIVGRYNSVEGSLAGSGETVFAVGTGNSTSNRRTGFHIDSGSNATISGSLAISGTVNVNGAFAVDDSNMNLTNSSSLNLTSGSSIYVAEPGIISGSISGIGNVTTFSASVASQFASITGSTIDTGSFLLTASVNLNTITFTKGDTTTFNLTVDTGSSTPTFPYTGSAIISGSLEITGSARGNVVALSITSNTASMDLSSANYFTLTLADTATTHITATNIKPGTSATLVITTGTNSSASLAPILLEPSGSEYVATNGSSKKDVLSFVAVDTTNLFVVSTKNMI